MRQRAHELFGMASYEDALAIYQHLVTISRSKRDPRTFDDDLLLAGDLFYVGLCRSRLGRHDQAIEPMRQSVEIFERHWRGNNTVIPVYAEVVASFGGILAHLGRADEAIAVTDVVADLRYALASPGMLALEPGLARALRRFAEVRVARQHELERALPAVHDVVRIYGALAQTLDRADQEQFVGELRATVDLWADVLEKLGRAAEAAEVLERLAPPGDLVRQRGLEQIWDDVRHCVGRQIDHPGTEPPSPSATP